MPLPSGLTMTAPRPIPVGEGALVLAPDLAQHLRPADARKLGREQPDAARSPGDQHARTDQAVARVDGMQRREARNGQRRRGGVAHPVRYGAEIGAGDRRALRPALHARREADDARALRRAGAIGRSRLDDARNVPADADGPVRALGAAHLAAIEREGRDAHQRLVGEGRPLLDLCDFKPVGASGNGADGADHGDTSSRTLPQVRREASARSAAGRSSNA